MNTPEEQHRFLSELKSKHTHAVECPCGALFVFAEPAIKVEPPFTFVTIECYCGMLIPFLAETEFIASVPCERHYDNSRFPSSTITQ